MSNSTSNPWFAATMGLGGLIIGYILATSISGIPAALPGGNNGGTTVPEPQVITNDTPADVDNDPMLGDENAPITLIEFTDYQCPFCARHYTDTYGKIKQDYIDTGKVKLVVRDFPLSFHPHAQKSAEAAECAYEQDGYWEMHDKLFETQAAWSNLPDVAPTFKQYAAELGLDTTQFDSCLDSSKYAQEVKDDMSDGSMSGIDGTPGFWILGPNGENQKISGAYPYETFKAAFDALL